MPIDVVPWDNPSLLDLTNNGKMKSLALTMELSFGMHWRGHPSLSLQDPLGVACHPPHRWSRPRPVQDGGCIR